MGRVQDREGDAREREVCRGEGVSEENPVLSKELLEKVAVELVSRPKFLIYWPWACSNRYCGKFGQALDPCATCPFCRSESVEAKRLREKGLQDV